VHVTVKGGYSPDVIRVKQGIPLRLVFNRQEASDCTSSVVFPDFQVSRSLPAFGATTLEFTPDRSGEFGFACGMNMIHGRLVVEPDGAKPAPQPETPEEHTGHEKFAQAVGIGPELEVRKLPEAEFSILGHGVTCPTCVANIEAFLKEFPGVDEVHVNFGAERVTVHYDPQQVSIERMQKAIEESGYQIRQ
jgi:Cu+-exporting ATPase